MVALCVLQVDLDRFTVNKAVFGKRRDESLARAVQRRVLRKLHDADARQSISPASTAGAVVQPASAATSSSAVSIEINFLPVFFMLFFLRFSCQVQKKSFPDDSEKDGRTVLPPFFPAASQPAGSASNPTIALRCNGRPRIGLLSDFRAVLPIDSPNVIPLRPRCFCFTPFKSSLPAHRPFVLVSGQRHF